MAPGFPGPDDVGADIEATRSTRRVAWDNPQVTDPARSRWGRGLQAAREAPPDRESLERGAVGVIRWFAHSGRKGGILLTTPQA